MELHLQWTWLLMPEGSGMPMQPSNTGLMSQSDLVQGMKISQNDFDVTDCCEVRVSLMM